MSCSFNLSDSNITKDKDTTSTYNSKSDTENRLKKRLKMDENATPTATATASASNAAALAMTMTATNLKTDSSTTTSDAESDGPVELPSEVWAHVCHYLPYSTVMELAVVNGFMLHQVMPSISQIYLFSTRELNAIHAKRLRHVESVYIYCLLRNRRITRRSALQRQPQPQPNHNNENGNNNNNNNVVEGAAAGEDPAADAARPRAAAGNPAAAAAAARAGGHDADERQTPIMTGSGWGLDYNIDTMHRIVPYLSQFSHLTYVYLGAMVYWFNNSRRVWDGIITRRTIFQSTTSMSNTSMVHSNTPLDSVVIKPTMVGRGDSNADAHRTLIHSICGAIASRSLSPSTTTGTTLITSTSPSLQMDGLFHSHAPRLCPNNRGSLRNDPRHVLTSFLFPQEQNVSASIEEQLQLQLQERRRNCIPCQHVLHNAPCSWLLQSSCNHLLCASPKERYQAIVQRVSSSTNGSDDASMLFQKNTTFITNLIVNGLSMRLRGRSTSSASNTTAAAQNVVPSPGPFFYIYMSTTCMEELMALVELHLLDTSSIQPDTFYQRIQHFTQSVHDKKEKSTQYCNNPMTGSNNANATTSTNPTGTTNPSNSTTTATNTTTTKSNSRMSQCPIMFSESNYTKLLQLGFHLDAKVLEQEYGILLYRDIRQPPRPGQQQQQQNNPFQNAIPPPPPLFGNNVEDFLQHVQHVGAAAAAAAFANHHDGDDDDDDEDDDDDDNVDEDRMHAFFQQAHGGEEPPAGGGRGAHRVAFELNGPFLGGGGGAAAAAAFVGPGMVMPNFHQMFGNQNNDNGDNNDDNDMPGGGNHGNVDVQIHFQGGDVGGGNDNVGRGLRQNPIYANILDRVHDVVREQLGDDQAEQFRQQHDAMMMNRNDAMHQNVNNNNLNINNNNAAAAQDGNGNQNMGGDNGAARPRMAFGGIILGNHGGGFMRPGVGVGGIQHIPLVMGFGGPPMNGPPPQQQENNENNNNP